MEFKKQAVQMLLDGLSAPSIVQRLRLSGRNLLYRWRRKLIVPSRKMAEVLDGRVFGLQVELKRV